MKFNLIIVVLLIALVSSAFMSTDEAVADSKDKLIQLMTGSFSSDKQAQEDESYYSISLHMYPIWESDSIDWLYVEQALSARQDKPYRQRVYKVEQLDADNYQTTVYAFHEPDSFIGKWKTPAFFDQYDQSILTEREGCAVYLKRIGKKHFEGSTRDSDCKSTLRGAAYATSKVIIKKNLVYSWDQGFDDDDKQVWGATEGGYFFIKKK